MFPEDFIVHEEIDLPLTESGPHRVYLMEKRSWNTADAIESVARASGVSSSMIRYAGLKDRHALTSQHISAPAGMRLVSANPDVRLHFLGFSHDFVSTRVLMGNRFKVTLRSVTQDEQSAVSARVPEVASLGFPNYYDDQRFGSVTEDGFFAERLLRGHLRGALRLHLTARSPGDSPFDRKRKEGIAAAWGKWDEVKDLCVKPDEIAVAEALSRGGRRNDLLLGVNAIPASRLTMYLSAYQSYLWNRVLGVVLASRLDESAFVAPREAQDGTPMHPSAMAWPTFTASGKLGDYTFYRHVSADDARLLSSLQIPTVARRVLPCDPEVQEAIESVLTEVDIPLSAFGLRGVKNAYFHSFYRSAVVVPKDLVLSPASRDKKYLGTGQMRLEFRLPAGAYATMLVKALMGEARG